MMVVLGGELGKMIMRVGRVRSGWKRKCADGRIVRMRCMFQTLLSSVYV
jgi:hypothetical protein